MKKLAFAVMVSTLAFTGATFAQDAVSSPAPAQTEVNINKEAPVTPAQTNVDVKTEQPAPAASVAADVNINKTETSPAPAPVSTSTTTEVWGLDGKTVLIGGALLLGIILIAVAAAGRDRSTTVVR